MMFNIELASFKFARDCIDTHSVLGTKMIQSQYSIIQIYLRLWIVCNENDCIGKWTCFFAHKANGF